MLVKLNNKYKLKVIKFLIENFKSLFYHVGYNPEIKPEGSPCTRDYRINRVRLFVDANNKIVQIPHTG
jgi:hypothetical protein